MKGKLFVLLVFMLAVTGCTSDKVPEPAGIGTSKEQLKRSPCACMEIKQDYSDWTQRT